MGIATFPQLLCSTLPPGIPGSARPCHFPPWPTLHRAPADVHLCCRLSVPGSLPGKHLGVANVGEDERSLVERTEPLTVPNGSPCCPRSPLSCWVRAVAFLTCLPSPTGSSLRPGTMSSSSSRPRVQHKIGAPWRSLGQVIALEEDHS